MGKQIRRTPEQIIELLTKLSPTGPFRKVDRAPNNSMSALLIIFIEIYERIFCMRFSHEKTPRRYISGVCCDYIPNFLRECQGFFLKLLLSTAISVGFFVRRA